MSFGINTDDNFDRDVVQRLDCTVHGFDPYIETHEVQVLRQSDKKLENAVSLKLGGKRTFHSIGITNSTNRKNEGQRGWMETYENILKHLNLQDQTIDYLKMDIEWAEWDVLDSMLSADDGDLMCNHVKQFAIETHSTLMSRLTRDVESHLKIMRKLEKCFRLFRRDQRFFILEYHSEWQKKSNFNLPLDKFNDEVDLAKFMFLYGELYFINKNFL